MSTLAQAQAELNKIAYDLRHGGLVGTSTNRNDEVGQVADALRGLDRIQSYLDIVKSTERRPLWLTPDEMELVRESIELRRHAMPEEGETEEEYVERGQAIGRIVARIDYPQEVRS